MLEIPWAYRAWTKGGWNDVWTSAKREILLDRADLPGSAVAEPIQQDFENVSMKRFHMKPARKNEHRRLFADRCS